MAIWVNWVLVPIRSTRFPGPAFTLGQSLSCWVPSIVWKWNKLMGDRFEEKAEDGELSRDGKEGGGLETIYAGGMHNLAIDEAGHVSSSPLYLFASLPPCC